jgi:hypothetical protein
MDSAVLGSLIGIGGLLVAQGIAVGVAGVKISANLGARMDINEKNVSEIKETLDGKRDKSACDGIRAVCMGDTADKLEIYHEAMSKDALHIKELAQQEMGKLHLEIKNVQSMVTNNNITLKEEFHETRVREDRVMLALAELGKNVLATK